LAGFFPLTKDLETGLADRVRHFGEGLVCGGSGAIAYLDR